MSLEKNLFEKCLYSKKQGLAINTSTGKGGINYIGSGFLYCIWCTMLPSADKSNRFILWHPRTRPSISASFLFRLNPIQVCTAFYKHFIISTLCNHTLLSLTSRTALLFQSINSTICWDIHDKMFLWIQTIGEQWSHDYVHDTRNYFSFVTWNINWLEVANQMVGTLWS